MPKGTVGGMVSLATRQTPIIHDNIPACGGIIIYWGFWRVATLIIPPTVHPGHPPTILPTIPRNHPPNERHTNQRLKALPINALRGCIFNTSG